MKFTSAQEMLDKVLYDGDLYNPGLEKYIFAYNDIGSICVYSLPEEEAIKLSVVSPGYWSEGLDIPGTKRMGCGTIYDDVSNKDYNEEYTSNLEFCERVYQSDGWMPCWEYEKQLKAMKSEDVNTINAKIREGVKLHLDLTVDVNVKDTEEAERILGLLEKDPVEALIRLARADIAGLKLNDFEKDKEFGDYGFDEIEEDK